MAPLILAHQGDGSMTAIVLDKATNSESVRLGNYNIEARSMTRNSGPVTNPPVALFICTGPDDYVIVARSHGGIRGNDLSCLDSCYEHEPS